MVKEYEIRSGFIYEVRPHESLRDHYGEWRLAKALRPHAATADVAAGWIFVDLATGDLLLVKAEDVQNTP